MSSALIAAVLFCICAFVYIKIADYEASWILYVGSILFFFAIAIATTRKDKKHKAKSTGEMVFTSFATCITAILISVIFCFILLMTMDSGFLLPTHSIKIMHDTPPATINAKTGGLAFKVFFAATVLCFFGGAIAAIALPFYASSKQD